MSEEFHPMSFPPHVLARISPELSLQRHLSIGVRPNLRTFDEFRELQTSTGELSRYSGESGVVNGSQVLGSSVVRAGKTMVVCTVTGGIIEEDLPTELINEDAAAVNAVFAKDVEKEKNDTPVLDSNASVYPVVEVERGRVGAPTDEEMILSQRLHETLLHSGILSKDSLKANVGLRSIDADGQEHIFYKSGEDDEEEFQFGPKRSWSFVLYAKIKVFSRSGPLFDLVWASLISALQSVQLPRCYIDENAADVKIPVKIRGNFGALREQYQITCDAIAKDPLQLNKAEIGYASNFGVVDLDQESLDTVDQEGKMDIDTPKSVMLTDLEGEEEESTTKKTLSVVLNQNGQELKALTVVGGITKQELKKAFKLAKLRSEHIQGQ